MKKFKVMLLTVYALAAVMAPSGVLAHKLTVYAYPEADGLMAEGFYVGGKECAGCAIGIMDADSGAHIANGIMGDDGMFFLTPAPKAHRVRLALTDRTGHRVEQVIELDEEGSHAKEHTHKDEDIVMADDTALVLAACEEQVDKLSRELKDARLGSETPGMAEVLGGIGYIMGIAGLWAFLAARKRRG